MKTYLLRFLGSLFMVLFVTACSQPAPQAPSAGVPQAAISANTALPLGTPNATASALPTPANHPTANSEAECHTQICMESTPAPTLSPSRQEQFFDMLKDNGSCELPCFLGIEPGETTWLAASKILEPFSAHQPILFDENNNAGRTYSAQVRTEALADIPITLVMGVKANVDPANIVRYLVIRAELYGNDSAELHDKHLLKYGLREIFLKHGPPDVIYYDHDWRGYELGVVYEKLKMVILISGYSKQDAKGEYKACPNIGDGEVRSFHLALASPADPIDVKTLIGYPFYDSPLLEDTAGLSPDDFYHILLDEQQPACFRAR